MKTTIIKTTIFLVTFTTLFSSCVKDDNYSTPDLNANCLETSIIKNKEVSQISFGTVTQYTNNDVIEAYVTSSDVAGNFFKSISFQTLDKTSAFSIPVDASSTFINYEPGRKVLIKMKGLYTDTKFGGKRIGSLFGNSSGGAEVGRLPLSEFTAAVNRSCVIVPESDLVKTLTIENATKDENLNFLIDLNNVQFSSCDQSPTYYDSTNDIGGATNHIITDKSGNTTILRISSFSNFAAKPKANGSGKIRGVMSKFGSTFQFTVRSEGDIALTGPRFTPLLNETFETGISCWTNYSVLGDQIWGVDTSRGNPGTAAKMSGFAGSNFANEDWLISPEVNLSAFTSATLLFDTAKNFSGNTLQAYISKNYIGYGDPYTAGVIWTPLITATFASATNYVWLTTPAINLTGFTGVGNEKVYIAFKYTSTSAAGATWLIDNVKVTGM